VATRTAAFRTGRGAGAADVAQASALGAQAVGAAAGTRHARLAGSGPGAARLAQPTARCARAALAQQPAIAGGAAAGLTEVSTSGALIGLTESSAGATGRPLGRAGAAEAAPSAGTLVARTAGAARLSTRQALPVAADGVRTGARAGASGGGGRTARRAKPSAQGARPSGAHRRSRRTRAGACGRGTARQARGAACSARAILADTAAEAHAASSHGHADPRHAAPATRAPVACTTGRAGLTTRRRCAGVRAAGPAHQRGVDSARHATAADDSARTDDSAAASGHRRIATIAERSCAIQWGRTARARAAAALHQRGSYDEHREEPERRASREPRTVVEAVPSETHTILLIRGGRAQSAPMIRPNSAPR
jgi:hypothetical protein